MVKMGHGKVTFLIMNVYIDTGFWPFYHRILTKFFIIPIHCMREKVTREKGNTRNGKGENCL